MEIALLSIVYKVSYKFLRFKAAILNFLLPVYFRFHLVTLESSFEQLDPPIIGWPLELLHSWSGVELKTHGDLP